jgi:beta-lactamase regulating signal transducer with metallopeptidase domain
MVSFLTTVADHLVQQSWQIAAVFVLVALACWGLRKQSAHWRYLLWLVVLAKCLAPAPISVPLAILPPPAVASSEPATLSHGAPTGRCDDSPPVAIGGEYGTAIDNSATVAEPSTMPLNEVVAPSAVGAPTAVAIADLTWQTWLAIAWCAGIALFFGRVSMKAWATHRTLRRSRRPVDGETAATVAALAQKLGLRAIPPVYFVDGIAQPFVWGWLRGSIYLPRSFIGSGTHQQRQAILTHEMAHVARWDAAANLVQILVQAVFFFHPLVWLANRQIRCEREKCCDEMVIAGLGTDPRQYGEAILSALVAEYQASQAVPSLAVAARLNNIEQRIQTILAPNRRFHRRPPTMAVATVVLAAAVAVPMALVLTARSSPAAENEATSVAADPAPPNATRSFVAKLPCGVAVELLGVSGHPSNEKSWWRPDGLPLAGPPCDPLKGTVRSNPHHVAREIAVRFHHRPAEPMGTGISFDPSCDSWAGDDPYRIDKTGIARMTASLPDQPTVTVRVRVAAGPWKTVCEKAANEGGTTKAGFAFSPVSQKNGRVVITVTHSIVGPQSRMVAVSVDGREHRADSWTINRADGFVQLTEEFSGLSPADVKVFRVQTRPYQQVEFRNVSLRPGQQTDVQVVEAAETPHRATTPSGPRKTTTRGQGLPLEGTVTDRDGKPIARAWVGQGEDRCRPYTVETQTDPQGRYRFADCNPGPLMLTAVAPGHSPELRRVTVTKDMQPVDFRLAPGKTLRLRVVDTAGRPLAGAGAGPDTWRGYRTLHFLGLPKTTDAQGRWVWDGAPADAMLCYVYCKGYMSCRKRSLVATDDEQTIVLHPALVISGRISDAATGKPVPECVAREGYESDTPRPHSVDWSPGQRTTISKEGRYSLTISEPAEKRLIRIDVPGYLPAISRAIGNDEGNVTIDFELKKAAGVAVLTPQGKPAAGATVAICTPQAGAYLDNGVVSSYSSRCDRATTDTEGRFSIAPQDSAFSLLISHGSGFAYVTQEQWKQAGPIRLNPWARVEGVCRAGGKPAAEQVMWIHWPHEPKQNLPNFFCDYRAMTDKQGRFTFKQVFPGQGEVIRLMGDYRGTSHRWISVDSASAVFVAGETTRVEMDRRGRPVVGRFSLPKAAGITPDWWHSMLSVRAIVPGPHGLEAGASFGGKVASDGTFRFDDVPAGDYRLTVRLDAPPRSERDSRTEVIGSVEHSFRVPEMPDGHSDEPLELGTLELTLVSRSSSVPEADAPRPARTTESPEKTPPRPSASAAEPKPH